MAQRKLTNIALFVSGEPENSFPDKIFMQYTVKAGPAEKRNQVYEVADPDPDQQLKDVWEEAIKEIKVIEGIETKGEK